MKVIRKIKGALSNAFNTMAGTEGYKYKAAILGGMAALGAGAAIGLAVAAIPVTAAGMVGVSAVWALGSLSCAKQYAKKKGLGK